MFHGLWETSHKRDELPRHTSPALVDNHTRLRGTLAKWLLGKTIAGIVEIKGLFSTAPPAASVGRTDEAHARWNHWKEPTTYPQGFCSAKPLLGKDLGSSPQFQHALLR